jgi:hypothetical protein
VRNRPKRPRYLDEAVGVHGEARLGKPRSRSRLRGPERFVNLVRPTVSRAKYTARDFDNGTAMMHATPRAARIRSNLRRTDALCDSNTWSFVNK